YRMGGVYSGIDNRNHPGSGGISARLIGADDAGRRLVDVGTPGQTSEERSVEGRARQPGQVRGGAAEGSGVEITQRQGDRLLAFDAFDIAFVFESLQRRRRQVDDVDIVALLIAQGFRNRSAVLACKDPDGFDRL